MNNEDKTTNISYSGFGIDFIPEQKPEEKKDENISLLKEELSNKEGIEILKNTEDTADNPEENFSSPKVDIDNIKEENIYK